MADPTPASQPCCTRQMHLPPFLSVLRSVPLAVSHMSQSYFRGQHLASSPEPCWFCSDPVTLIWKNSSLVFPRSQSYPTSPVPWSYNIYWELIKIIQVSLTSRNVCQTALCILKKKKNHSFALKTFFFLRFISLFFFKESQRKLFPANTIFDFWERPENSHLTLRCPQTTHTH